MKITTKCGLIQQIFVEIQPLQDTANSSFIFVSPPTFSHFLPLSPTFSHFLDLVFFANVKPVFYLIINNQRTIIPFANYCFLPHTTRFLFFHLAFSHFLLLSTTFSLLTLFSPFSQFAVSCWQLKRLVLFQQ